MTIEDVSARHAISASSNQPVNAPPTRRSRNGSRASTVSCPRARGFCTCKDRFAGGHPPATTISFCSVDLHREADDASDGVTVYRRVNSSDDLSHLSVGSRRTRKTLEGPPKPR